MKSKSSIFLIILALACCGLYSSLSIGAFNASLFDASMILVLISLVIYYKFSQNSPLSGFWIRPSLLFLIGYLAVNFQYLADFRVGFKTLSSRMIIHPEVLNHCLVLGVVGILAFVAGYVRNPINGFGKSFDIERSTPVQIPTTILTIFNVVIFLAFLATIDIVSFVTGADYGNQERTNSQFEGLLYVSNALIVLSACLKSSQESSLRQYLKAFPVVSLGIIVVYMIMRLLSGDRGPFIYTALLLFFGYAYTTRIKISLSKVLVYVVSGMLLISLVGIARSMDTSAGFGERLSAAFDVFSSEGRFAGSEDRSISPLTEEMGFSFFVNQTDVNAIEVKKEPLNYGLYTFTEIVSSFPFMPSFLQNTLGIPPEKFSSSGFANYHFFGGYERNWGIGTTVLGDFYLQFGVWGVLIGMFIAGIFLRFLDTTLYVRDKSMLGAFTVLLVILFSAKSVYMPRAMLPVELPRFIIGSILLTMLGVKRLRK